MFVRVSLVVEAVNHLKVRSYLLEGEVVRCDEKGVTSFHSSAIGGAGRREPSCLPSTCCAGWP